MASAFAKRLAEVALQQHQSFQFHNEDDSVLSPQIRLYWERNGFNFPGVSTPWSAVFISWCVRDAGADNNDFAFSPRHAVFVNDAINNPRAFRGFRITDHTPGIGDIIQNNRNNGTRTFEYASTHEAYESHTAIVVELGTDTNGRYALTIGGNESDSIRKTKVILQDDGFIKQRTKNPYISILAVEK